MQRPFTKGKQVSANLYCQLSGITFNGIKQAQEVWQFRFCKPLVRMLFFLFSTDGSETKQRRNVGLIPNLIALLETL